MKQYPNIFNAICSTAWAIMPEKMEIILAVLKSHSEGNNEIEFEAKKRATKFSTRRNVAILPLVGTISQRIGIMDGSGGTSTQGFSAMFDDAVNDPDIGAIVIDIDSPGGGVYGSSELSEKIFNARGKKPIIASVNSLMASAAYWIGSAADEIVVTPGGEVGSIGVLAVHTEFSKAEEMMGVTTTIIKAGKHKAEINPHEPISEEARAALQSRVDDYYSMFISDVARNRGVTTRVARLDFGEGLVFGSKDALSAGMIDKIGTLEQVVGDLIKPKGGNRQAEIDLIKRR